MRRLSTLLYPHVDESTRSDYVGWCFIAQRMFDGPLIINVILPFVVPARHQRIRSIDLDALRELRALIREYNEEASRIRYGTPSKHYVFEGLQCNPTGCAAGHSGHTFLTDICKSAQRVEEFCAAAHDAAEDLFVGHSMNGQQPDFIDIYETLGDTRVIHTGSYYRRSMARVAVHCIRHHRSRNARTWPACASCDELWDLLLEDGCRARATRFGLLVPAAAAEFCAAMQTPFPEYCMCDLACWLCLSNNVCAKRKRQRECEQDNNIDIPSIEKHHHLREANIDPPPERPARP